MVGKMCLLVLATLLQIGCRRTEAPAAPLPGPAEATLLAQVQEVRGGRSDAIVLEETLVTDSDLLELRHLPMLKELTLRKTDLSDVALETLSEVTGLEKLVLGDTSFTDAAAKPLSRLSNLRT